MLSIKNHPFFAVSVFIADTLAVLASFYNAYFIRFYGTLIPTHKGIPDIEGYFRAMAVVVPIYLLMFRAYHLYRPERNVRRFYELVNVAKAVTMSAVLLMALTFIYREFSYSRAVLVIGWVLSVFLCATSRYVLIQFEYHIRRTKDRDKVLILGANRNSRDLIRWAKHNLHYGQDIVGILSNDTSSEGKHFEGVPVLGNVKGLEHVFSRLKIDEVVVAEPALSREDVAELMLWCENKMIGFKLVADFYGLITHHVDVEYISNVPLLGPKSLPLDDLWNRVVKRVFDIFVSLFSIIFLLPIMGLIAITIKLNDRGPIFYKQERVGQDERHFNLYKFRTMAVGAEQKTGPVWATAGDARATLAGKILRKSNLDELPQFWNVLKGDMSLVGPRPERPHFVKEFRELIPRYMARHKIKSGLTGWAQIHGLRGNTSLEERIKYDLYYMENWTLVMDVEILFATMFAFKNAY